MISPYKITWLGLSSLEFDVWTELAFDEDDGNVDSHLGREAVVSEIYSGVLKRAHNYKWKNDFIATITFIKKDYSDFTPEENRKILKWLTGSKNASFLEVYKDDSEVAEYYILGNWINVSQYKFGNGRVVGYIADFESLAPWAFSDIQSITKEISEPNNNTISLHVETDEPQDLIYPRITIVNKTINLFNNTYQDGRIVDGVEQESPSDVSYKRTDFITIPSDSQNLYIRLTKAAESSFTVHFYDSNKNYINTSSLGTDISRDYSLSSKGYAYARISTNTTFDGDVLVTTEELSDDSWKNAAAERSITLTNSDEDDKIIMTKISNNVYEEIITIDGANRVISSDQPNRIFGDDFNWNWIGLSEGENTLSVIGPCNVTIEWREPIKCGEW